MAVLSYREVLPRTAQHRFGESPTADIKYVATLDQPTATQTVVNTIGIFHGAPHPELSYLRCLNIAVNETDKYHIELTYSFEVPKQENLDPNPLARPDVWSFATGGAQVPALTYFEGNGNNNIKPLQNSAKEYFEGLTALEAEVRATISSNRANFPLAVAAAVTNCVNSQPFLGGPKYSWQCAGITGQPAVEVVNDVEIRYWQITSEVVYRRSGWNLLVPDVGWNYLENGQLKRAWVRDPDSGEKVPSGSPRALQPNGDLKPEGQPPTIMGNGEGLRVFPAVDFSQYFGTPQL